MRYIRSNYEPLIKNRMFFASILCTLTALPLLLLGCGQRQFFGLSPFHSDQISKEGLHEALEVYEESFVATIKYLAADLDDLMPTQENRRRTIRLRDQTITACRSMLEQDDPKLAFVDSWVLAVRLVEYFESGHGKDLFGKHQGIVVIAAKKNQEHLELIGRELPNTELYIETRNNVYEFASRKPIGKNYSGTILFATKPEDGRPSPFESIINLPMAPFRFVGGVTQEVAGTRKLSDTAEHFSDIIEGIPESARWQLLLLMYDMEKLNTVKSAVNSLSEFAESSSRFADATDRYPEKLREQASILLDEIDTKQLTLQATISQLQDLISDVDDLTWHINWQVTQLIVLIFVLALVYRIAVVRFINKAK